MRKDVNGKGDEEDGRVYSWGKGKNGVLGNGSTNDQLYPQRISHKFTDHQRVIQISCGKFHALALTVNRDVFSWGYGEFGQVSFPPFIIVIIKIKFIISLLLLLLLLLFIIIYYYYYYYFYFYYYLFLLFLYYYIL